MKYKYCSFQKKWLNKIRLVFLISFSINTSASDLSRINTIWEVVSDSELDSLRGGFTLPSGVVIDFSFEQVIYRNKTEVFSTSFELPTNLQLNTSNDFSGSDLGSIIQNNYDDQLISTMNTVNIDISNLGNIKYNMSNGDIYRNIILPSIVR